MLRYLLSTTGLLATLLLTTTTPTAAQARVAAASPALGLSAPRVSYHLHMGASFAGRYGSATFVNPTVSYQLTNRFSVFGGVTYLRTLPGTAFAAPTADGQPTPLLATNHYLLQGGGTYALSPRLALTGAAWKDLTPTGPAVSPYAGFGNMGSGVHVRADYRLSEHMTISGGVRVSQGATSAPGYSPFYAPGSPFGY